MILEDVQLVEILRNNPARATLNVARKKASRLNMHITGENLKDAITIMEDFEDDQKKNMRQKYARSNKDMFARVHRPIDKVFTAKGGSTIYSMPESAQKQFAAYLADIRNGLSLRKWVHMVALPAYLIDPMGLVFIEVDTDGVSGYPTYKSTSDIFDYKLNGRRLEYVIFSLSLNEVCSLVGKAGYLGDNKSSLLDRLGKSSENGLVKTRYYRVVDDVSDKIIEWEGGDSAPVELPNMTLPNPFLSVPAIIISDIVAFNTEMFQSPDDTIVELANDFLTDCSVFNIWKKLHGFPKAWRIRSVCPTCMGNRHKDGRECSNCNGTGYSKKMSVRDEIIVPLAEEGQTFPTEFAGYITPNIEGWKLMTDEMDRLEVLCYQTLWGTPPKKDTTNNGQKTAAEILYNQTDLIERLHDFSDWGQSIERFIVDSCGQLMYGSSYKGCSVNYGDRYVLESPDVLWEKYKNARGSGAPQATLDGLLRDYYESRYEGSPVDLEKAVKLMRVEPWTHLTIQQVENITTTEVDKASKIYFSEWVSTKQDMEIIMGDEDALRADLLVFAQIKADKISEEIVASAANGQPVDGLDSTVGRSVTEKVNI
jgi:hypothetical protein